jgi:hypothetical protein
MMATDAVQLPTPAHISPAWLAQPVHSPERRRFSVLCWRGWCDHEFKIRAIAALCDFFAGTESPPADHLPVRKCPIPALCQCECHDGGTSAVKPKLTATGRRIRRGRWTLLSHEWNGDAWRLAWRLEDTTLDLERDPHDGWVLYRDNCDCYYQPRCKSLSGAMLSVEQWYDEEIMKALIGAQRQARRADR